MRRRAVAIVIVLLLVAFPLAWTAPLLRAGLPLPLFAMTEVTVVSGVAALWRTDPGLAALVAGLAIVAPYAKLLAMAGMAFGYLTPRAAPLVALTGRLAMADVFLIALYIVIARGAGAARVETAWGLWLFTACVGASLLISWATPRPR